LQTLYSIIAEKRLAEKVLNVDSVTWLLESYSALRATAATNGFFFEFNTKLRRTMKEALANRNIKAADKLWNIGSKSMPTMMKIAYAALLHTNRRVDDAKRVLTEIFSNAEPFDLNNISTSALLVDDRQENEAFLGLFARIFKLNAESRRRLLNGIRFREFEKLIDAGHLEEAFSFAKDISAETGRAFGQVELMGAALRIADMQLLNNVIGMVQQKHDKNAALIDFGVALLENERIEHAARIFAVKVQRDQICALGFIHIEAFSICFDISDKWSSCKLREVGVFRRAGTACKKGWVCFLSS
uniref:TPR_MalT domain-containing protein n=1 Tax=Anisakis simplex TaxID=6269 RepID=A0A0M3J3H5_ANISI